MCKILLSFLLALSLLGNEIDFILSSPSLLKVYSETIDCPDDDKYYRAHQERYLDQLVQMIASKLGVIIHGDINQKQLEKQLNKFNIQRLMTQGPYKNSVLSIEAQKLILKSYKGLDRVVDIHLHNLGYDEGNYVNPKTSALGVAKWKDYFTFAVLRYASGIASPRGSTEEARKRIHLYAQHFPKFQGHILPIHAAYDPEISWEKTGNYLSNESAEWTAESFKSDQASLVAAISLHPLDPDWEQKMEVAYAKGIRLIKWMPPQSIDPMAYDTFYDKMKSLGMVLIAHAGPEHAIPSSGPWEDWGNPLRFRKALDHGVTVIMAHCGHRDLIPDLDKAEKPLVQGYKLYFRIAKEYPDQVYGDLAAVTAHYGPKFVKDLLKQVGQPGIQFIYGSDYPYTNLVAPGKDAYELFAKHELLNPKWVQPLKEIRQWNPLLANFVFTRLISYVNEDGEVIRFPDNSFSFVLE